MYCDTYNLTIVDYFIHDQVAKVIDGIAERIGIRLNMLVYPVNE